MRAALRRLNSHRSSSSHELRMESMDEVGGGQRALPEIHVSPKELIFEGNDHTDPIVRHLALTNPHDRGEFPLHSPCRTGDAPW